MKKFLIIPDTHGRTFWKDVFESHSPDEFEKIIFLGDYVDPYPFEGIDVPEAIENFEQIIEFKKLNWEKVILLVGNHDFYYYMKKPGPSRWSHTFHEKIEMLFEDNQDMFQFAYQWNDILFTHAGCLQDWIDEANKKYDLSIVMNADSINDLVDSKKGINALGMISRSRGGYFSSGSCIWCDVSEHSYKHLFKGESEEPKQVFGHTLQLDMDRYYSTGNIESGNPQFGDDYAMLDCRSAFIMNAENFEFERL